jgi:hypothetical protein
MLSYTNAAASAHLLAALTTGLEPDLLALITGDQLTSTEIAGPPVSERMRPALRALSHHDGPLFPGSIESSCGPG